jgi:hypothetical protein
MPVLVSVAAASHFQSTAPGRNFNASLSAQLPLRNIHWKSPSRPSIRTIQELDVNFIPWDASREEHTSQIPVTLLDKPLLNIYVVNCEVSAFKIPALRV